jgi:hypothetical protein
MSEPAPVGSNEDPRNISNSNIPNDSDYGLWLVANAAIFQVIFIIIAVLALIGVTSITNIKEVADNWSKYRCDPSIMPFASIYGHDVVENFNYCMSNIFGTFSNDTTSSFGGAMNGFTGILQMLLNSINGIRTSVATLKGGIDLTFQEFIDRISVFFLHLRLSAIRLKYMMARLYAIVFSIMYMGTSGVTGMSTFANTTLFGFVEEMSCFPLNQMIEVRGKGFIEMKDVKIGDYLQGGQRVNGIFTFFSKGQPMVKLDDILVSNNHYVMAPIGWVKAEDHPDAIQETPWSEELLICLNTNTHTMNIGKYLFRDFDECDEAHIETMKLVERMVNGHENKINGQRKLTEYTPAIHPTTMVRLANKSSVDAKSLKIGDKLASGGYIIGIADREVTEVCNNISASTLVWTNKWERIGELKPIQKLTKPDIYKAFLVTPNSAIELEDGTYIRDYIEICSSVIEEHYSKALH